MRSGPATGRVHIIGAGLAGLAAAVRLTASGRPVIVHEAAPHAGGRCRSYYDSELGCRIDNGNHLLLAGNYSTHAYLEQIGAQGTVEGPSEAVFPFIDAVTKDRWEIRPNRGVVPWWIFSPKRRVPGTRVTDYLAALALWRGDPSATVSAVLNPTRNLFGRLWEPLAVAALNTSVDQASATLFWDILRETLGRGGAACRPLLPRVGLTETFVQPAISYLLRRGAEIRFGARLRALRFAAKRVSELVYDSGSIVLGRNDDVILATPAAIAARLVPALIVPDLFSPIVNAHFRCNAPEAVPLFIGVIGGAAQWIFRKPGVLSVTVSAADRIVDLPAVELCEFFWRDVALAYRLPLRPVPPARIIKERRATFLASPEQLKRRPRQITAWGNLLLAGDYVTTGLPATIEGAIRSGFAAARLLLDSSSEVPSSVAEGNSTSTTAFTAEAEQEQHRAFHE
jgi:squalene-associated FAD-dependent desaturase